MLRLKITPEAEKDIERAFDWYEGRQLGLGHLFLDCPDVRLRQIQTAPESHAVVDGPARLALVNRFPYVVCYRVSDAVIVHGVFHGHRDPTAWQSRVSDA